MDLYTFEGCVSGAYSDFHGTDFAQIGIKFHPQRYIHGTCRDQILCCCMYPGEYPTGEEGFIDKCWHKRTKAIRREWGNLFT